MAIKRLAFAVAFAVASTLAVAPQTMAQSGVAVYGKHGAYHANRAYGGHAHYRGTRSYYGSATANRAPRAMAGGDFRPYGSARQHRRARGLHPASRNHGFHRRGDHVYLNGHRGTHHFRHGHRRHNGYYFPHAAFNVIIERGPRRVYFPPYKVPEPVKPRIITVD